MPEVQGVDPVFDLPGIGRLSAHYAVDAVLMAPPLGHVLYVGACVMAVNPEL